MSKKIIVPQGVWIVLPAYNEESYLATVLKELTKHSKKIIVVDDGSTDKTPAIAKKYTKHVLSHKVNLGKGASLKTASEYAFNNKKAKAVLFMDADDQHKVSEMKRFFAAYKNGAKIVLGVRQEAKKIPVIKRIANNLLSILVFVLFGQYIPDIPSGYKLLSKNMYEKLSWTSQQYEVEAEIAARLAKYKLPFVTVCISTIYHDKNKGMTFLDAFKLLGPIINWRFSQ